LYISNTIVQERVQKLPDVAEAKRFFNYPYEAIEEALANAVYHKGYNEREPIEVRVLPDRIEIVSHPGADRSITMDGLKNYRVFNRRYRNRRIGEFLKELHLTEGRNTGFGKILRALEKNGSPKPLFETDDERTSFAATIFIHPGFIAGGNDFGNNNGNDSGNENQSDNAECILKIMKETPHATIDQIVSVTGISKRTVSRIIKELKGKDIIRREGTKNGTWIVLQ
jgi:ATP-dependent DNA helicase RecG